MEVRVLVEWLEFIKEPIEREADWREAASMAFI